MVLTGDSLLVGDVGRPISGGGDAAEQYEHRAATRVTRLGRGLPRPLEGRGKSMWPPQHHHRLRASLQPARATRA